MTEAQPEESDIHLCDFCRAVDWVQLTTGVFNPQKAALQSGFVKSGEHNLGSVHSASSTCSLCQLIASASRSLKPWWPIGHLLDKPEEITCALWSARNRIGSSLETAKLAQADMVLDTLYKGMRPGYKSTNLAVQEFWDSLQERGIYLDDKGKADSVQKERRRNKSLNRLVVLAGISPVKWTAQTFLQLHPCVYPLRSVDDYVGDGEDPFSAFPTGRLVKEEVNVRLLRKWYETCRDKHGETCSQPPWLAPETLWPAQLRLLDVRRRCLVDAKEPCPYLALSYVWGDEIKPFRTIRTNVEEMKTPGFLQDGSLPKTILDTIELAKGMGVDFLWVDRLCIIQDSDIDKAIQIPQMDLVYSRAAVTIVATCGTSTDGLAGINSSPRTLLTTANPPARVSQNLSLMNVLPLDDAYSSSAWTTRGWTFQEGLCSRRTLIITPTQVFWSCETSKCCESLALEAFPTPVHPNDIIWSVLSGHRIFGDFGGGGHNFAHSELDSTVRAYASRQLGEQSDALDAFTGVLRRVAANSGHEFYWGHSVTVRFDESLAWTNIVWYYDADWRNHELPARRGEMHKVRGEGGAVREVRFPSWSWLGWKNVLGLTRVAPRQVVLVPELEILRVGVDGKAVGLSARSEEEEGEVKKLEPVSKLDMCGVDESTSAGWKGDTSIDASFLHDDDTDGEFLDSGRLLFWTSHAVLNIEDDKMYNEKKEQVGELKPFWPNQAPKPTGKHSFIVVSRKYNDDTIKVLRAERRLNVLLIEWDDPVKRVASRICSGEVDEGAWVALGELREWVLVTLA
ncbi:HET-domain-containing protein [Hypoxylon fragiforme]|uniref:HET-domain-containing protein n=1 Tax=Hypoxylon fragiforme TaxID=63214 RepID=UPI0020C6D07B|nr:HET-domain-containing protein [Hypoxylon fragiforme]KAI2611195.1 HET-domain-containing protein [Hypoxylon fragiforme]